MAAIAPVEKSCVADVARAIRAELADHHEARRVAVRQRPQQTAFTTLKIVVLTPSPTASISIAVAVKPGDRRRSRTA